jgi:hypothetical protein
VLKTLRLSPKRDRRELNHELRSWIGNFQQHLTNPLDIYAQFFGELSPRCVLESFAWLQLTARKFPKTAMAFMSGSLADQVPVVA